MDVACVTHTVQLNFTHKIEFHKHFCFVNAWDGYGGGGKKAV